MTCLCCVAEDSVRFPEKVNVNMEGKCVIERVEDWRDLIHFLKHPQLMLNNLVVVRKSSNNETVSRRLLLTLQPSAAD